MQNIRRIVSGAMVLVISLGCATSAASACKADTEKSKVFADGVTTVGATIHGDDSPDNADTSYQLPAKSTAGRLEGEP